MIAFLLIAGLLYLNARSFKADPSVHLSDKNAIVLMSMPMQFGIVFMLVLATGVFYHIPRFIIGNHPDSNPVEGTYNYLWYLDEAEQVEYLLRDSELPNKASLIRQADIADYEPLHSGSEGFAERGQLHFLDEQNGISHAESKTHWAFSHDSMLLQGKQMVTGEIIGYVGQKGFIEVDAAITDSDRFDSVPFLIGEQYMQTRHTLYEIDISEQLLLVKFAVSGDDFFRSRPEFKDHFISIVSNEYLYLFDPEDFREEQEPAFADYVVPHPEMFSAGAFIGLYRMVDGYLVTYHDAEYQAFDTPGAEVVYARLDGSVESLHTVSFPVRMHPAPIQHFEYAVSPVLNVIKNAVFRAIRPAKSSYRTFHESVQMHMSLSVNLTAAFLSMLGIVGVIALSLRVRLERSRATLWTAMAVFFGLPALVSFALMNRLRSDRA